MAYRGQSSKHSQRQFPQTSKPKPAPVGSDTVWIPEFVREIETLKTPITTASVIALALGSTEELREKKLRDLTRMGILQMRAVRVRIDGSAAGLGEPSVFSHYEWTVNS